jgi:hypothetical protein
MFPEIGVFTTLHSEISICKLTLEECANISETLSVKCMYLIQHILLLRHIH